MNRHRRPIPQGDNTTATRPYFSLIQAAVPVKSADKRILQPENGQRGETGKGETANRGIYFFPIPPLPPPLPPFFTLDIYRVAATGKPDFGVSAANMALGVAIRGWGVEIGIPRNCGFV